MNTNASFDFDQIYHVYNRTNNKEKLFKEEKNKYYFLKLLQSKLSHLVNINAYALLDNHFHFLITVKSEEEIIFNLSKILFQHRSITVNRFLTAENKEDQIHNLISISFSGLFNSYSQSINKAYARNGNLFCRPFKRSQVFSESKLKYLYVYIHKNSMRHGKVTSYLEEKWTSYNDILRNDSELVDSNFAINIFGGKKEFIESHRDYELARI
jgi:REP element-mobilizing transposase RayT